MKFAPIKGFHGRIEHQRMGKNRYFRELNPWYKPYQFNDGESKAADDDVLLFESRFESGNLKKVI